MKALAAYYESGIGDFTWHPEGYASFYQGSPLWCWIDDRLRYHEQREKPKLELVTVPGVCVTIEAPRRYTIQFGPGAAQLFRPRARKSPHLFTRAGR